MLLPFLSRVEAFLLCDISFHNCSGALSRRAVCILIIALRQPVLLRFQIIVWRRWECARRLLQCKEPMLRKRILGCVEPPRQTNDSATQVVYLVLRAAGEREKERGHPLRNCTKYAPTLETWVCRGLTAQVASSLSVHQSGRLCMCRDRETTGNGRPQDAGEDHGRYKVDTRGLGSAEPLVSISCFHFVWKPVGGKFILQYTHGLISGREIHARARPPPQRVSCAFRISFVGPSNPLGTSKAAGRSNGPQPSWKEL